jgi:acetamidase/formamidase
LAGHYSIGRETFHYLWSKNHKPVISIRPGDDVCFDINDVSSWQISNDSDVGTLSSFDDSKLYPLAGPICVEGAEPGDTLTVDVLDVENDDFGWSAILPGHGLLEEFDEPFLYKWNLKDKHFAHFERGIRIPIRPFCGVMGVAPPEEGSFEAMPPGKHGGNMDIRHLTVGSRLQLPVWVRGALFSTGDLHAAMGDGEVCVSAVECPGHATFRFGLIKGTRLTWPRYTSRGEPPPRKGYHVCIGIGSDLMLASKAAVRNTIDYLTSTHGLSVQEAYVLCSVAADLRIHEVVDQPSWVVGCMVPLDIFP